MASSRKRPRVETDDNRAECPFSVILDPETKKPNTKKRKRGEEEEPAKKIYNQLSPFSPSGKFKTHETLDVSYTVEPSAKWQEMTRYNSFVLNGSKYFSEGFIFVANESTIERQRGDGSGRKVPRKRSDDDWVARILEIRASDEHHVYARVYWMYWPDELPAGTTDGKKYIQGRQPYHGNHELVASNHMDIINVVSVTSMATVNHWVEENDDEIQNALYWRQAFDFRNLELSGVEPVCSCNQPENPDKTLVGCSQETCKKWLHDDCLIHDALMKTYERLGKAKPHKVFVEPLKKEEKEDDDTAKNPPLSPTETGADETQATIDVKSDEVVQDNVQVKGSDDESSPPARGTSELEDKASSETPKPAAQEMAAASAAPKTEGATASGRRRRSTKGASTAAAANGYTAREKAQKPYLGMFQASLKMDASPPEIEIEDLRENVEGGEKKWTESIKCLLCQTQIV